MQHVLSLEVPDTRNACILRIVDTSVFNSSMLVTCPRLWITAPGFNTSVQFTMSSTPESSVTITPGFILNLTSCDLELQSAGCGTYYNDLSDGIYVINYSVAPNDVVFVEYNHLRITNALNKYFKILCDLDRGACEPPQNIKDKMLQLNLIRTDLDAAKALVEYCHEANKGMELYNYAVKRLDKMLCKNC